MLSLILFQSLFLDEIPMYLLLALCIVVPIIILMIVALIIALVKRFKLIHKYKDAKLDLNANGENIYLKLFGEDNILNVSVEMSRVSVEVKDIEKVDTQGLKDNGASGVLLVGNTVKCSYKENAEAVYEAIKGAIK